MERITSTFYGLCSHQAPKSDFLLSPIEFLNVLLFIFCGCVFYEATDPVNHMTDMIVTYWRRTHYCQDCYRVECWRWDQSGWIWRRRGQHLKRRSLFSLRKANLSKTKQTLQSGEQPHCFDQVPAFSHQTPLQTISLPLSQTFPKTLPPWCSLPCGESFSHVFLPRGSSCPSSQCTLETNLFR